MLAIDPYAHLGTCNFMLSLSRRKDSIEIILLDKPGVVQTPLLFGYRQLDLDTS